VKAKHRKRLDRLASDVDFLRAANARQTREIAELRETARRNDITIRGAIVPWLSDLAEGVTDGTVQFSVETEAAEVTSVEGWRRFTPGLREWHCTYTSSRRTVEDGELVEHRGGKLL
jgi:hypothetical protein